MVLLSYRTPIDEIEKFLVESDEGCIRCIRCNFESLKPSPKQLRRSDRRPTRVNTARYQKYSLLGTHSVNNLNSLNYSSFGRWKGRIPT